MDEWLEEDEPVYTHPRDPYTRVDILASSRHVRVEVDGDDRRRLATGPASCSRPACRRATTCRCPTSAATCCGPRTPQTHCPYKGTAELLVGRRRTGSDYEDLVWIYRTPLPESQKIAGLACFYNEKVDLYIDGHLQERPHTHFS